ncbi:MAG: nitrate reductase subunit alpha [Mycobacterium leprae]
MARRDSQLLQWLTYLKRGPRLSQGWLEENPRKRRWEDLYRSRWQTDKITRSTHGVNCTGSCSWKVHVKDGIIVYETQQVDYPGQGPDFPDHEPRGCPRGATTSWYEYSPARIRYPYLRGVLMDLWRKAKQEYKDPVEAWKSIVTDPEKRRAYMVARGKGGFVRSSWDEAIELVAASTIHTIKTYGPDRVVGFSPIPAMSMVSYASGARFLSLIGGTICSFYDWYADLPPASPQIWGEQTDVPESGDWYNSRYMIIWGTNLPMTRTPDAHFMTEVRYRGCKVAGVAPDYAEYIKFCDTWLPAKAGTDAALALAMLHVILKEFYVDHPTEYFEEYVKKYTDLPFLVKLEQKGNGYLAGPFVNAADLGQQVPNAAWKTALWDSATNAPAIPNGSIGFRWDGSGKWNLKMETPEGTPILPLLTFLGQHDQTLPVDLPYFGGAKGASVTRHVPVKQLAVGGQQTYVTTVFDLLMANIGVPRGLAGDYPTDYDDLKAYTPAWQESITGVKREQVIQVAREFADTAERTQGRCLICMGAGTNHWYHSDLIYRAMISLVLLCGCQGVNGGGWAHYVGQEKIRPLEGLGTLAFGQDWYPGTRQMNGTSFFYFATDQYRYHESDLGLAWPGGGKWTGMHPAEMNALAARFGWIPSFPQFTESSIETARKARAAGAQTEADIGNHVAQRLVSGDLGFAMEHPDAPENWPRVLMTWRCNLLTSSGKGIEYFLSHLLGTDGHVLAPPIGKPNLDIPDSPPAGKLDLFVTSDFRMSSTGLFADVMLPAATWYEKTDISTTDMHPFIHPFQAAITPPWEAKTDWATFQRLAAVFSRLAAEHLGELEDVMMLPLMHDSPSELGQEGGKVLDWRKGETQPIPGKTMPRFAVIKRDYPHVYNQIIALGPRTEQQVQTKGIPIPSAEAYKELIHTLGPSPVEGPGKGRPSLQDDEQAANAIMALSGATNGKRAVAAFKALEKPTGLQLEQIAKDEEAVVMTVREIAAQPRLTLKCPVWSGLESHERRYSPFTLNTEYLVPFRTLTGRQTLYLDHEIMRDYGEMLPIYRPRLVTGAFPEGMQNRPGQEGPQIVLSYLTPHQKWGIHTMFWDTWIMQSLFRGGQTIWLNHKDAEKIGIKDNDWIEAFNRNGACAARAVVTHRMPEGVCYMYHAQDRTVGVPGTKVTGERGGPHNSLTRVIPKPTHMIGGYAQLSAGFNYYGPCGHQRDQAVVIRRLNEVDWLEG